MRKRRKKSTRATRPREKKAKSADSARKSPFQARLLITSIAMVTAIAGPTPAGARNNPKDPTPIEQVVTCRDGNESRKLKFMAWLAGLHNGSKLDKYLLARKEARTLEEYRIRTSDGRTLVGWRVLARAPAKKVAVVVGMGNLATADYMVMRMEALTEKVNYDFILIDYRGYARSRPATPSLSAFVQDQMEVGAHLRTEGYELVLGYGTSLGGIVLAKAVERGMKLDRLVTDSIPSDLKAYECDESFYPTSTVAHACPEIVAITSDHDSVVFQSEQSALLNFITSQSCKGKVVHLFQADHAFNDKLGSPGDLERIAAAATALQLEPQP